MSAVRKARSEGQNDLQSVVRELARRYRLLVSRLSAAELLADSLAFEIARLEELAGTNLSVTLAGVSPSGGREERARERERLRRLAETGVTSLLIETRADGFSDVRVDGGKPFTLPPALADLLHVLAMEGGPSEDELVGWKSVKEVEIMFGKIANAKVSRHAVTQNVYRLRRELYKRGGVNPFLIQTNRRRGLRFALRRAGGPVITDESE